MSKLYTSSEKVRTWTLIRLHQSNQALQNIKCVLNTMIIWDSIRIEKVGRHHLCNLPEPTYQRTHVTILCEMWLWKENLRHDGEQLYQYQQNKY
jgi:hypothetical protein